MESGAKDLQSTSKSYDNRSRKKSSLVPIVVIQPLSLRDTLDDYLRKCPKVFNIIEINEKYRELCGENNTFDGSPYCVFALKECQNLNRLISAITTHLENLSKGLSGYLNMTRAMEEMMSCIGKYRSCPVRAI